MGGFLPGGPTSAIPIIGPVLDIINGAIKILDTIFGAESEVKQLASDINAVENAGWANAIGTANYAFEGLSKVWDVLKGIGEAIGLAVYHAIVDYLIPLIKKIIEAIKWLKGKLDKVLKPLQKILKRIRDFYINHILKWELLAIQIISVVRLWLTLLRLLHVKWAAQLDADLQKIQSYITDTITPVVSTLNEVSTILGLAINPLGFISKNFMAASITSSVDQIKRAAGYGSARIILPDEKAEMKAPTNAVFSNAPVQTMNPDGSVMQDPILDEIDQSLDHEARTAGVTY